MKFKLMISTALSLSFMSSAFAIGHTGQMQVKDFATGAGFRCDKYDKPQKDPDADRRENKGSRQIVDKEGTTSIAS